ncbi:GxxExxY protein [bacterium]|nr:GxxExxY protein [bacterium]
MNLSTPCNSGKLIIPEKRKELHGVNENILCYELEKNNIPFEKQIDVPIRYDNQVFSNAFRADIILDKKVIIELKSVYPVR